ncbi:MAG: hypothetical protein M5U05_04760 [Anaerolineales bacterium]|nr:hypothetical protein [Anaerolineales bacterium]
MYAIGSLVTINGEIDGSLFLLGEAVQINNVVQGTVYGVSLETTLGSEAALQRNLYYVGLNLITEPGASIGRDLIAWCSGAQLNGSVGRDMKAVIGPLQMINAVLELIGAPQIRLRDVIRGSAAPVWRMSGAGALLGLAGWEAAQTVASPRDIHLEPAGLRAALQAGEIDWSQVGDWALNRVEDLVVLFVFGLLAAWLFPRRLIGAGQALEKKPLPALGYGLLGLVLAVNLLGVVLLLAIIFLFIGLWIGTLDLWALALAFWSVAYPALALGGNRLAVCGLWNQGDCSLLRRRLAAPQVRASSCAPASSDFYRTVDLRAADLDTDDWLGDRGGGDGTGHRCGLAGIALSKCRGNRASHCREPETRRSIG